MFVILILLPSIKNIKKSFFVCVAYIILILGSFLYPLIFTFESNLYLKVCWFSKFSLCFSPHVFTKYFQDLNDTSLTSSAAALSNNRI